MLKYLRYILTEQKNNWIESLCNTNIVNALANNLSENILKKTNIYILSENKIRKSHVAQEKHRRTSGICRRRISRISPRDPHNTRWQEDDLRSAIQARQKLAECKLGQQRRGYDALLISGPRVQPIAVGATK